MQQPSAVAAPKESGTSAHQPMDTETPSEGVAAVRPTGDADEWEDVEASAMDEGATGPNGDADEDQWEDAPAVDDGDEWEDV